MSTAVLHPLTEAEAATICADLAERDIPIRVETDVFDTVHLWAGRPTTLLEEITALRPFIARTDSRLVWHGVDA